MKTKNHINSEPEAQLSLGEELFAEAAAALFEEPGKIACDISVDEASEFESLRSGICPVDYSNCEPDTLSLAAEDVTPYGETE